MSDYTYRKIITDREGVATGEKIVNVPDEVVKQIRAKAINDYYNKLNEKINTDTRLKETIKEIHDNVAREMYCKGIDDFLTEICKMIVQSESNDNYRFYACEIKQSIADLAEELKAGVEE